MARLEALLPGKALRRTSAASSTPCSPRARAGRDLEGPALAWSTGRCLAQSAGAALLDALLRARSTPPPAERIVLRATQLRIGAGLAAQVFGDLHQATDGWALETAGYVDARVPSPTTGAPRRVTTRRPSSAEAGRCSSRCR